MHQYLHKYLVLNKKLGIPDVGNFSIQYTPSKLDASTGLLFGPTPVVQFKQEQTAPADKVFFDFLAEEMAVDEVVAIRRFHDYVYQLKSTITAPQGGKIEGIGNLRKEESGLIIFSPYKLTQDIIPQVHSGTAIQSPKADKKHIPEDNDRELTEQEEEDIRELLGQDASDASSDNWWIYAVILLLIGVGAVLFYYV
ncbi:MAG: hypothetical protein K2X37_13600 [Chitinophagaceae bacterium]|jgi:hypothetical protein|nr:hypothetical protein [Chitinophagaceae bacterium]